MTDTTLHVKPARFSILFGAGSSPAAASVSEALKHSEMVHPLCKFDLRTHNPRLVIVVKMINFRCTVWDGFLKSSHIWYGILYVV